MKLRSSLALMLAGLLAASPAVAQGDAAAGRKKAVMCQTCHGLNGLSRQPNAPNLAGQVEAYLLKALKDYKEGLRADEQMSLVIQSLSDADMADLAAYYTSIPITVEPPQ